MTPFLAGIAVALIIATMALRKVRLQALRTEDALRTSEARFRTFMDNSPVVAYMKDEEGRFLYANEPLQRHFQTSLEAIRGTKSSDWLPADVERQIQDAEAELLSTGPFTQVVEDVPAPDGRAHSWLMMKFPFPEAAGRTLVGGVAVDITEQVSLKRRLAEQLQLAERLNLELARANERLNELATTDGLTGLVNYRHLRETLEVQFVHAQRHDEPLSLLLVDVDRFKDYNDSFGHHEGDEALIAVARAIRNAARDDDVTARYGGEEFAVLLPNTDADAAQRVGHRLRHTIASQPWPLRAITASVGVATTSPATRHFKELLELADAALYLAKNRGRNRVVTDQEVGRPEIELTPLRL